MVLYCNITKSVLLKVKNLFPNNKIVFANGGDRTSTNIPEIERFKDDPKVELWNEVNMNINWYVIENIAIISAMVFLVVTMESGWWALLLLFCNFSTKK